MKDAFEPPSNTEMLAKMVRPQEKPKVHIGYDHESLRVGIITKDGDIFHDRGLLEDADHIEVLKKAFEALGCEVTTQEEY